MGDRGGSAVVAPRRRRGTHTSRPWASDADSCSHSASPWSPRRAVRRRQAHRRAPRAAALRCRRPRPPRPALRGATHPGRSRSASPVSSREMTLAEKIGQMTLVEKGSIDANGVRDAAVGGVLSGGGGAPPENTPASWHAMVAGLPGSRRRDAARDPDPLRRRRRPRPQQRAPAQRSSRTTSGSGRRATRRLSRRSAGRRPSRRAATGDPLGLSRRSSPCRRTMRWGRTYEGLRRGNRARRRSSARAFIRGLPGLRPRGRVGGRGNAEALRRRRRHRVGLLRRRPSTASTRA